MGNSFRTISILIVVIVWGINFLAPLIIRSYQPPPEINSAAMTIVGALAVTYRKNDRNDNE